MDGVHYFVIPTSASDASFSVVRDFNYRHFDHIATMALYSSSRSEPGTISMFLALMCSLVVAACGTERLKTMTDKEFSIAVLSRSHIGQDFDQARAELESLGLVCNWVAEDPIPPTPPPPPRFVLCSLPLQHLNGCSQQVQLLKHQGKVSFIQLEFTELAEQRKAPGPCGR